MARKPAVFAGPSGTVFIPNDTSASASLPNRSRKNRRLSAILLGKMRVLRAVAVVPA
jgi:hypothetical protein